MAAANSSPRTALLSGGFSTVAFLVLLASVSAITGSLSSGLMMQLALGGGEMPPMALVGAVCFFVAAVFVGLGLLFTFVFA